MKSWTIGSALNWVQNEYLACIRCQNECWILGESQIFFN